MSNVDIKDLFEAGVHFGHKTSRWHPKMAPFIHSKRQDSHIINLEETVKALDKALPFLTKVAGTGKQVLFVGTKKQAKEIVKAAAEKVEMPYVTERWIGGMLTNVATVTAQIKKLKDLERRMISGELEKRYNKLEVQRFQEEIDALNVKYGGIKNLNGNPGVLVVVDAIVDDNAIKEAANLGVPVVAIVDSNADPSKVNYAIPGNDDSLKGLELLLSYFTDAVQTGKAAAGKVVEKVATKEADAK